MHAAGRKIYFLFSKGVKETRPIGRGGNDQIELRELLDWTDKERYEGTRQQLALKRDRQKENCKRWSNQKKELRGLSQKSKRHSSPWQSSMWAC